ncbi:uncharacterized protein LOC107641128 [Arachis ipaensis]|uniref:uncharacterized protein LOC107641128 n=1 Tax=Arachis ipaensis TaxID=130454 RepID=UPI0007AF73CF|nr:uncharacterized protein LOC107641128 [Arachis ipaensis]
MSFSGKIQSRWYHREAQREASCKRIHSSFFDDHSLFIKKQSESFTAILVYVDDLVLIGNDIGEINSIKQDLDDKFKIKDLGDLKYFLGMEVARSNSAIHIYQRKYTMDLLRDFGYLDCKPLFTPFDYSQKLSKESGTILTDNTVYRQLIGRLLYLTNTRPDISYAVGRLSQFLDCATTSHLQATFRVLRYLKGRPATGLFFSSTSNLHLTGFTDVPILVAPFPVIASCLGTRSLAGRVRSKPQLPSPLQKLNIGLLLLPLVKLAGYLF